MSLALVHEHEIQRQHVRVRIPARIRITGREYALRDLSASGAALEQVTSSFAPGQRIALTLILSFAGFSFHADLNALVEYYNPTARTMGCRFDSLSNEQVSLLNTIIKSYMSGVVVTQGDLLNVVARDNFLKLRVDKDEQLKRKTPFQLLLRALPIFAAALLGLAAFTFAGANMYEKFTILKAPQASVKIDMLVLRSMADGAFKSSLPEGAVQVAKGQTLGFITPVTGFTVIPLVSPCDCTLAAQFVKDGMLRMVGEPVFKLIPNESLPVVKAAIASDEAHRLHLKDKAAIHIAGETGTFMGSVIDIAAEEIGTAQSIITIKPDQGLPFSLAGRPARVFFYLK